MMWGITMYKKLWLVLVIIILFSGFVAAERYVEYTVQNATIVPGGAIYGDTKLTDYHAIGYLCDSIACEPPISQLWDGDPVDSTDDYIILTYPSYLSAGKTHRNFFQQKDSLDM